MDNHEIEKLFARYHAEQTQQIQAIREESDKTLPEWLEAPGKVAAFIVGIGLLVSLIFTIVTAGGRIYTAPQDIEAAQAKIEALEAHHYAEEELFSGLVKSDSVILANQEAFAPQVDLLSERQLFLYCSRANRDMERGVVDSLPTDCRADWER